MKQRPRTVVTLIIEHDDYSDAVDEQEELVKYVIRDAIVQHGLMPTWRVRHLDAKPFLTEDERIELLARARLVFNCQ